MYKRILAFTLVFTLLFTAIASAGINKYPEIDEMITNNQHEKIAEFIRKETHVEDSIGTTLEIDDSTILGPAYPEILGHGGEGFTMYSEVCLDENGELAEDYLQLLEDEFYEAPVARFGGHNSNYYSLINSIGKPNERKIASYTLTDEESAVFHPESGKEEFPTAQATQYKCGTIEFIKAMQAQNPDIQFIFCQTITHDTPENAANFVRFCLDDPSESYWGQLRVDYGIEKVNLLAIELGNELYCSPGKYGREACDDRVQWYIKKFREFTDAIHEYHPEVETSPCVVGDYWAPEDSSFSGFRNYWNEVVYDELGPECKYISMHLYYSGYEPAFSTNAYKYALEYLDSKFGQGHGKQFLITEHAKWMSGTQFSTAGTLESALATAQYLNTLFSWRDQFIRAATYYCFTSANHWALMRRSYDNSLVVSGVGKMYGVFLENLGDRVVKTTSIPKDDSGRCDKSSTAARFSGQAYAKDDKTLKVILTNRLENTAIDIDFTFLKNKYTLKEETIFTAPQTLSFVYNKGNDPFIKTTTEKNEPNFSHYVMPNHCMVVLTLESTTGSIPQFGEVVTDGNDGVVTYDGEDKFSDIESHWANAEINLLAEAGVISGTDAGKFLPNSKISKAEFAAMLCKLIGTDSSSNVNLTDVTPNDWYYDYVRTLVNGGYIDINTGTFNPDAEISLKDAITILYRVCSTKKTDVNVSDVEGIVEALGVTANLTEWENKAFAYASANGFLTRLYEVSGIGLSDGLTRAETAALIYRLQSHLGITVEQPEV